MQQNIKRKLTAILSADVAGYSRLMDDDEVSTVRTLQAYRKIISDLTSQHNGRVIDNPGDNLLAEFSSVVDAVQCAVKIQQILKSKNDELPDTRKMDFRIGINLGDVIEEDDRIYGDGVNIAARIESLADPGGICISGTAYDQVVNKLDLKYDNLGEHQVKNIRRPIRVYRIPVDVEPEEKDTEDSILDSIIDMSVPTDKPSIAVLPFVNMSDDPSQEYFADGITEEIITALSKIPDMLVIASTSMFTYKGQRIKVKQVGRELGVKYVLEGSVRKAGNRIRVTAQLIEATTEIHLWSSRYDRESKDIFELQDELTIKILSEIDTRLFFSLDSRYQVKGTDNLEAYLKHWQGFEHMNRFNKNDNSMARKIYAEVIRLDPNWSIGYAMLAFVNIFDYYAGWSNSTVQCIKDAAKYSNIAISLDDTVPTPHGVLSNVYLIQRHYDKAIEEAEIAIAQQPNYMLGYYVLGNALVMDGNPLKAQEMLKKAMRLSPKYPLVKHNLGVAYFGSEQYLESICLFEANLQERPDFIHTHLYLTAAYVLAGMKDKARIQSQELFRLFPRFSVDKSASRLPYKNQSDTDRILNALRKAGLK